MKESTLDDQPEVESPYQIRSNSPEVRAKLTPDLYRALHREAAAEDVTVAELLRRIVARHYEPMRQATIEQLQAALAEASAERQLLVAMLDLMYQGLLVRLEKPEAGQLEARVADAVEGHRKWRTELARRLADGATDTFLALIRDVGKPEPEPVATGASSAPEVSA
jgi:hypothetical protein